MKVKNSFLNILAGKHDKILVFDCEFWHVYGSEGYIPLQKKENEFFMPREVGGFILTKTSDGDWNYKKHFFVTLNPPKNKDVSFVSSEFSNVTEKTAYFLDSYQSILGVHWASAYLNLLPEEKHIILLDSIDYYLEDPNIKSAHKPPSWIKTFLKEYSESLVIVKGTSDIEAMKNACKFHGIEYLEPKQVYDIADWNVTSYKKCGTAKLEGTFKCILPKLDKETRQLLKILPLGEAHDPSSDAAMTLIVALYIISRMK
jgi:hypothetical protein